MKQFFDDLKERWPIVVLAVLFVIGFVAVNL